MADATERRIIERDEVGYAHGSGWGTRPLPASESFIHYPGAKAPPGPDATLEEDLEYARYLDEVGYARFKDADLDAEGIDAWPGEPGAGVSYSLLFPKSGRVIRGHDPLRQSSHTKGHNYSGMGYCVWISQGEEANAAQLEAVAWALNEQVRRRELISTQITGGHRDVYSTICPTDALYNQIPEMNTLAGGQVVARRRPTRTDLNRLVANQRARGFEHYCTPYSYDSGVCPSHGGRDPHSRDSRHRHGGAIDFGWPGPPISDTERIHVLLECRRLAADPEIDWRILFDISDINHPDHGHVDDGEHLPGFNDDFRDRWNIFAKDGYSVFVSPKAFPDHVPGMNRGFSIGYVSTKIQPNLKKLGRYNGADDGYLGPNTTGGDTGSGGVRGFQRSARLVDDGDPGPKTLAALEAAVKALSAPAPAPAPAPDYSGFTTSDILAAQRELKTAKWYTDTLDGSPGPNFQKAMRAAQTELKRLKLYGGEVDLLPGPKFMTAIREYNKPAPPTPPPPPPSVPVRDISGSNRYATAANASKRRFPIGAPVAYLAETQTDDAGLSFADGPTLLVAQKATGVPSPTADELRRLRPKEVIKVSGGIAASVMAAAARYAAER